MYQKIIPIKDSKIIDNPKDQKDLIETIKAEYPTANILGFIKTQDQVKAVLDIPDQPMS